MDDKIKLRFLVEDALENLAVPPYLKGYKFLREGIILVATDEDYLDSVTKALYPMIGSLCSASAASVERGIRHAITVSFSNCETKLWSGLFYRSCKGRVPANSHFIAAVARSVQRKMHEIEEGKF